MFKLLSAVSASLLVAASLTGCATVEEHPQELHMTDGWVRVSEYSDHVDGMTGAFATFDNHTDHDITIVGGTAEIAGMVEVHEVVMIDDEMKMQAKEGGIVIPAGESLTLEPGGLHIMLMGLKQPILVGDKVTMTIDLEGYEDQTVTWDAKTSLSGDEEYEPKK
jgi:copper(I)-binding protein